MKTFSKLYYVVISVLLLVTNIAQSQNGPPFSIKPLGSNSNITLEFLNEYITSQIESNNISGFAASVIVGDKIVWTKEAGLANRENGMTVTDSTLFLTYSVSKMFTGLSLMQQYDKGLFDLDDDINDYLPFQVVHPQYPETTITFRMLMTHTAGITEPWSVISSVMVEGYDYPGTLHEFLESFFVPGGEYYSVSHFSGFEPGTQFSYSNVGAALAGYLTEVISGIPFNDYCKDSLLLPMGMDNSSFLLADIDMDNLARPYEFNGTYIPLGHISNATLPAGFLRTSNSQMANFVLTLVNNGNFNGNQIIVESTLDTMTMGHIIPNENIGLFMAYDPNFQVWGHTGGLSGMKTLVFFHKEEKWGISILTNGDGNYWDIAYILEQYAREFSALSLTDFSIDDENGDELLESGEDVDLIVGFRNSFQHPLTGVKVILSCNHDKIIVVDSIFNISTINPDEIISNEQNPFKIITATIDEPEEIVLDFIYYEDDQQIGWEQYPVYTGHPSILLIDDEEHVQRNSSQSLSYYKEPLNELDVDYYFRNLTLSPLTEGFINQFQSVIWFTGIANQNSNILPQQEQDELIQYLEQGGNLLLSSQNASDYCGNSVLFTDYLKVNHLEDSWAGPKNVSGIDNDTIGNGFQFFITAGDGNNSAYSPSVIETLDDGIPVFKYTTANSYCGVRHADDYKTMFISFGIEAIDNSDDRKEIIYRTLVWFDDISVGLYELLLNTEFHKGINIFPNPSSGSLNVQVPSVMEGLVEIDITDLSGKQVYKQKLNKQDENLIILKDLSFPKGVYILNVQSDRNRFSQKLLFGF